MTQFFTAQYRHNLCFLVEWENIYFLVMFKSKFICTKVDMQLVAAVISLIAIYRDPACVIVISYQFRQVLPGIVILLAVFRSMVILDIILDIMQTVYLYTQNIES